MILPSDFVLTDSFLSVTRNDWVLNFELCFVASPMAKNMSFLFQNNAAIVVTVDPLAHPSELRQSHLPRYQLGKEVRNSYKH